MRTLIYTHRVMKRNSLCKKHGVAHDSIGPRRLFRGRNKYKNNDSAWFDFIFELLMKQMGTKSNLGRTMKDREKEERREDKIEEEGWEEVQR